MIRKSNVSPATPTPSCASACTGRALPGAKRRIEKSLVPPPKSATSTVAGAASPRANLYPAASGSRATWMSGTPASANAARSRCSPSNWSAAVPAKRTGRPATTREARTSSPLAANRSFRNTPTRRSSVNGRPNNCVCVKLRCARWDFMDMIRRLPTGSSR
jgi:hypothetical protein